MLLSIGPVARAQASAAQQRAAARRFLARRGLASREAIVAAHAGTVSRLNSLQSSDRQSRNSAARHLVEARAAFSQGNRARFGTGPTVGVSVDAQAQLAGNLKTNWIPVGPVQTLTPAYGAVTGRVTSIAVDAADATGNTVYVGTTGGGVWKSTNAAGALAEVTFAPITDDAPASTVGIAALSIGAVSVQPDGGVILAGTGDPNDALDSYYGSGILRSTDHGASWTAITEANINDYSSRGPYSFYGEGFSGFAWSTVDPDVVVAAVTQSYDGAVVHATQINSVQGLYYSTDAGVTWSMATLTDGPGQVLQSPALPSSSPGEAITAVVWNPVRRAFFAAVRAHGYYSSSDGVTWTRLANQPGPNLNTKLCSRGVIGGSVTCPILRGALAVQPQSGDMFAITVDSDLVDQGIWRDVCTASGDHCSTGSTVMFGSQLPDSELQDDSGRIPQGDYDLWLAAVPIAGDTLLYVGTVDIFKRSLAAADGSWRNATNSTACAAARVAPAQHTVAAGPAGLMYFGNDGGVWRTTDAIGQQQAACSADDARHFDNLNSGLGSLAEVTSVAQSPGNDTTLLVAEGANGSAATTTEQGPWAQVMNGMGAFAAIDPANADKWYVTTGPGVSVAFCGSGGACSAPAFGIEGALGDAQTDDDGESLGEPAVWMLDPQDSTRVLVGTCRVWRGSAPGLIPLAPADAISPVLDDAEEPDCSEVEGQIQSLGGSGTIAGKAGNEEVLYAGMEGMPPGDGFLPYGGLAAGHVFTATVGENEVGAAAWTDTFASPVLNEGSAGGQFNPGRFSISSVVVDTHDPTGKTVYATVQGFSEVQLTEPLVYRSTDQGQSWTNITANLPDVPVNALVVDPGNADIVYLATDAGVYETVSVVNCGVGAEQCWSPYGLGLPDVPVTALTTDGTANDALLIAGTYGRGVWEMLLASTQATQTQGMTTAQLSPETLIFGTQPTGSQSAARTVTITNTGSTPLVVNSLQATGDFAESDNCAGATIAAGLSCTAQVMFAPTAQGTRAGGLTVRANVVGGQLLAGLSGTGGTAAQVVLSPLQLVFPATALGTSSAVEYLTISNTGIGTVSLQAPVVAKNYKIVSTSCTTSEPSQVGCTVGIVFSPNASGADIGTLSIVTGAGNFSAELLGSGLKSAADTLSATALTFTAQTVGTASAAKTVTIMNGGGSPLTLITATSSLSDYQVNASACATNVPAQQACSITVAFAPVQPGARTAKLTISDSLHAGASALTVVLNGNGLAPSGISLLPSLFDFGTQGVGSTSTVQSVTLTNDSATALTGLAVTAGGDFAVKGGTCAGSLAAGRSCTLPVTFTPSATGTRSGALRVDAHEIESSVVTTLSGIGLSFALSIPNPVTQTVVTGTAATYQVSIVTLGESYPAGVLATLALACTGAAALPAGSTCVVNPASVSLTSAATASATITVMTPGLTITSSRRRGGRRPFGWALALVTPMIFCFRRRRWWPALPMLLLMTIGLSGCGVTATGGSKTNGTGTTGGGGVPSSYVMQLTASAPGIQQSVQMTLVLEQ